MPCGFGRLNSGFRLTEGYFQNFDFENSGDEFSEANFKKLGILRQVEMSGLYLRE